MKKNKNLLLIAAVLGALAFYFILRNTNSTTRKELREFAFKDTSSINRIFLADRNGNSVSLERGADRQWMINKTIEPRRDMVKNLMDVIYSVDVKSSVAKTAYNNVVKNLSSGGIKCEIYAGSRQDPVRVYYVGGSTEDALGTFMMLENSSVPFVTEIRGFNGYLTPRYSVKAIEWKNPVLFRFRPEEIKSVSVTYPAFPDRSLFLEKENERFAVMHPDRTGPVSSIDSIAVDNYLDLFREMYYESLENNWTAAQHDSVLRTSPLAEVAVKGLQQNSRVVTIYPMPVNERSLVQQDSLGRPLKYDVDRMIGYIQEEKAWVVIQHTIFDRTLRTPQDFDRARTSALKPHITRPGRKP